VSAFPYGKRFRPEGLSFWLSVLLSGQNDAAGLVSPEITTLRSAVSNR
jgi:hypothetical protein